MSIISKSNTTIAAAREAYIEALVSSRTAENEAMNSMLNVLRNANHPMTAAQISAALNGDVSVHEVAGNLRAMRHCVSRFEGYQSAMGHILPSVAIPTGRYSKGSKWYNKPEDREVFRVKAGTRTARIAELDERGNIIPNTTREVTLHEANRYSIERIDY